MASAITRPPSTEADWFAQNGITPTYTPSPNQAMTYGNDLQMRAAPSGGDPLDLIAQWQNELPVGQEGLQTIVQRLNASGIPAVLATHGGGQLASSDAIVLPDGRVLDLISGWDGPNPGWTINHSDNYDPSRNIVGPNGQFMEFGEYLGGLGLPTPTARPFASGQRGGGTLGSLGSGGGLPGGNPMIDFALDKVQRGLERGAAAKGTLLTGGFQEALGEKLSDYAMFQGFQPAFNNNLSLANLGLNATQTGNQNATSYGNNLTDLYTNQANANAAGTIGQANNNRGTLADLGNSLNDTAQQALWWWQMNRGQQSPTPQTYWPTDQYQGPSPY
jgi:hypothetical protein